MCRWQNGSTKRIRICKNSKLRPSPQMMIVTSWRIRPTVFLTSHKVSFKDDLTATTAVFGNKPISYHEARDKLFHYIMRNAELVRNFKDGSKIIFVHNIVKTKNKENRP